MALNDPLLKLAFNLKGVTDYVRQAGPGRAAMLGAGLGLAKGIVSGEDMGDTLKSTAMGGALGAGAGYANQKWLLPGAARAPRAVRAAPAAKAAPVAKVAPAPAAAAPSKKQLAARRPAPGTDPERAAPVAPKGSGMTAADAAEFQQAVHGSYQGDPALYPAELKISSARFDQMVSDLEKGIAPEGAKPIIHEIIKRAQAIGVEPTAELVAINLLSYGIRKVAAGGCCPGGLDAKFPDGQKKQPKKRAEADPAKLKLAAVR